MTLVQGKPKEDFVELYIKYRSRLERLASIFTINPDVTRDIVQDTFLHAYEVYDNFRGDSNPYTWLYRSLVNRAKNHLRRTRPSVEYDESTDIRTDSSNPEALTIAKEEVLTLRRGIERLSENQRTAIELTLEGWSNKEIAERMGTSVGTIKTRRHYGTKRLQELLAI